LLSSGSFATLALALAPASAAHRLDPNLHAGNLNCTLPLACSRPSRTCTAAAVIMIVLLPVFIGSIILSQSRAGVALLVLSSSFCCCARPPRRVASRSAAAPSASSRSSCGCHRRTGRASRRSAQLSHIVVDRS
jgi:hypothetical protein